MMSKREVEDTNDNRRRNNGGIDIAQESVNMIIARKSISWSYLGSRKDLPYNGEVLKKQGPSGLSS
jgi:hypothetical protein